MSTDNRGRLKGSVELYSRGLKMARDDSTTPEQWAEYKQELERTNIAFRFRKKLISKIEVIENGKTEQT